MFKRITLKRVRSAALALLLAASVSAFGVLGSAAPAAAAPYNCFGNAFSGGYAFQCLSGDGYYRAAALCTSGPDSTNGVWVYGFAYQPGWGDSIARCGGNYPFMYMGYGQTF